MTLYSNIMDTILDDFLLKNPELSVAVKTLTTRYLSLVVFRYDDDIKALHKDLVSELTKFNFYSLFSEHSKGLQFQGKFFDNLVEMVDNIFLYL